MAMTERVDAFVIGAGVVGLECARAGKAVLILERHRAFVTETSSRNSDVIHASVYYPAGSRKASLCVAGRNQLYDFCEQYGVDTSSLWKTHRCYIRRTRPQTCEHSKACASERRK